MNPLKAWFLRRRLASSDVEIRRAAVRELGVQAHEGTITMLGLALNDPSDDIAKEALESLATFRTPEALELISAAVRRLLVERTIPGTAKKYEYSFRLQSLVLALRDFGPAAAPVWISILQNRDAECATGDQAGGGAASYAAELLGNLRYTPAAGALLARLGDPSMRGVAAQALGAMTYAPAVGPLIAMLSDPDEWVRRQVAKALLSLAWEPTDAAQRAKVAVLAGDLPGAVAAGAGSIRPLIAELFGFYATTGKHGGPSGKSLTKVMAEMPRDRLPRIEHVQSLVLAIKEILGRPETGFAAEDLAAVASLPDFRVSYEAEIEAQDTGSGNEYLKRVPSDCYYDCSPLRQRASELLSRGHQAT